MLMALKLNCKPGFLLGGPDAANIACVFLPLIMELKEVGCYLPSRFNILIDYHLHLPGKKFTLVSFYFKLLPIL